MPGVAAGEPAEWAEGSSVSGARELMMCSSGSGGGVTFSAFGGSGGVLQLRNNTGGS
ncbi:hypothetical protein MICRO8M_90193 [Microbacterium sp. 8M]|nr:hypothetical protein MICRO8M_90193 [Microbacterium sp. 8M]